MTWLLSLLSGLFSSTMSWVILAVAIVAGGYVVYTQVALSHRAQRIETLEAQVATVELQRDQAKAIADANAAAAEQLGREMRAGFAAMERSQQATTARLDRQSKILTEARRAPDALSPVPDSFVPTFSRRLPKPEIRGSGSGKAREGADPRPAAIVR